MVKKEFPVYVINLDRAYERRQKSIEQLHAVGIDPIIVSAYDGHKKDFPFHQYKHLSRGKWWEKDVFKPGAFACYLSHAKCWERIATGHAPYALILEDDIIVNKKEFEKFNIKNIHNSFDILFVNHRVTRLLELTSSDEVHSKKNFLSFRKTLLNLLNNNKFSDNLTPGGDGYIVSKKGAVKLLKMMEQDKICMGVDYAMIFGSLTDNDLGIIKELKEIPHYLKVYLDNINDDAISLNYKRISLDSYIYNSQALININDSESDIKHEIFTDFSIFSNKNFLHQINFLLKKLVKKYTPLRKLNK